MSAPSEIARITGSAGRVSDEDHVITEMGALAGRHVVIGALALFDEWSDRAAWMRRGTRYAQTPEPLPSLVTLGDAVRMQGNIIDALGEAEIVAQLKGFVRPIADGRAALANAYAPTLGDALQVSADNADAINPHLSVQIERRAGQSAFVLRPLTELGRARGFIASVAVFSTYRSVEPFARGQMKQLRIEFGPQSEAWAAPLREAFECSVSFGGGPTRIIVPQAWEARRNPFYDADLWRLARHELECLRTSLADPECLAQLRKLVGQRLVRARGMPRLEEAASALAKSPRTLSRTLSEAGTSFREVVEQERRTFAESIVRDRARTLQEVSERLGFADRASFSRSFRRWFGVSPARYREGDRTPAGPMPETSVFAASARSENKKGAAEGVAATPWKFRGERL